MALDLEEQEQLDELKTWWNQNGKMLTTGLIVLLFAYVGYHAWQYFQHKQAVEASTLYQALLVTDKDDLSAIKEQSTQMIESYTSTPYAGRAALFAAKANYAAGDTKSAKVQLDWAIVHASETSVSALASLQLANLLVEEKKLDAAMKLLNTAHDSGFDGLFWDLKGDILASLGKTKEAKTAYERALTKLEPTGKYRIITQQKLDALG